VSVNIKSRTANNARVHTTHTSSPLRKCKCEMCIGNVIDENTIIKSVTSDPSKCVIASASTTAHPTHRRRSVNVAVHYQNIL
jgi:hypothetical protein